MKILYVTTISNTINAFLIPHIRMLIEQGHQVDVVFNTVQEVSPEIFKLGCKIHNIEFQRSPFKKENLKAYKRIKQLVIEEGYELIHTHTPVASFITRLACRNISDITIFYTAHGFHFFKGAHLKNWLIYYPIEKLSARWTDKLITMNEEDYLSAKRFMKKVNSVYKVHGVGIDLNQFVPNTPELKKKFRKSYGYKENDFILIYVAELSYRKHQDLLIDSINTLKSKIPNLKLLLVGNGELLEKYRQQVKDLKLQDTVNFLGYRNDVNNLMMIADIAVSTSRQEGLPVNIMEAMATGLPLVVTNCRGNRDLISHSENGYIIGLDDNKGLVKAIETLYKSKELRKQFGEKSIELVKQNSLERVLKEYKQIYTCF